MEYNIPMSNPTIEQFCDLVDKHSAFPGNQTYNIVALAGEAGEVANQHKKQLLVEGNPHFLTDDTNSFLGADVLKEKKDDELGDTFFYLIRAIKDNGSTLEEVMRKQQLKLEAQSVQYGRTFLK